ncbi:MAG: carboxypeptidase-like regulatory domain-containing protein [Bacteroidetes bacterium]|jgi:hypothetical protein|nr:carboxypeptidase-like regulatory domain-containing protein [Bacteroidota bacterium]
MNKTPLHFTMKRKFAALCAFILLITISCSSGPGEGGSASIKGKIYAKRYVSNCNTLSGEYWAPDEEVYIVYGDDPSYGDRIRTGPDGTYWFRYLRPGKYTIYAYSTVCTPAEREAVSVTVEITSKKQEAEAPVIEIKK